jgi:hypothetical protein
MTKDLKIEDYIEHVLTRFHPETQHELYQWTVDYIKEINPKSKYNNLLISVQVEKVWNEFHESQLNISF